MKLKARALVAIVLQVLDSLALLVVVIRNRWEDDPPRSRVRMLGQML
jgi:hypothetical protein